MLTPPQALAIALAHPATLTSETVPLAKAGGRVLCAPIHADRDFPPFDRVTMDGIALCYSTWADSPDQWLLVAGTQLAGMPPLALASPSHCLAAMTGAVMPTGADSVVRIEDVETRWEAGQQWARVKPNVTIEQRQSLHHQARDRAQGDLLVAAGTYLGATEIAVAATVGLTHLAVSKVPRFAIISTGNELVPIGAQPLPHQIRQSNAVMLQLALAEWHAEADLFHFNDDQTELKTGLANILASYEVVILSGGVSEGVADFVPGILAELGAIKLFHKVAQRPGKPFWFGIRPAGPASAQTTIFALPGNPVSTFCCYHQYVTAWLRQSLGLGPRQRQTARLAQAVKFIPDLTYFLPVIVQLNENGTLLAQPITSSGSGDLASLLLADGFLELAPGQRDDAKTFNAGIVANFNSFRQKLGYF